MKVDIYNQKAEKIETVELPDRTFGLKWNPALVWQVAQSERSNLRQNTAHTKGRGEVRGGGKKPWRQKGTGRARHGSTRSPIWIGGGVTHGPTKERNYKKKINKKMKKKAFFVTLSQKLRDKETLILNDFNFPAGKTKEAATIFKNLSKIEDFKGLADTQSVLVALPTKDEMTMRAIKNISKVGVKESRNINLLDLLSFKYLLLPKESIDILQNRF